MSAGGTWAKYSVFMRRLINIFLCMSQIGSNAVYILFVAQNILPVGSLSVNESEYYLNQIADSGGPLSSRLELQNLHRAPGPSCHPRLQHQEPQISVALLSAGEHPGVRRSGHHLLLHLRHSTARHRHRALVLRCGDFPNLLWDGNLCL